MADFTSVRAVPVDSAAGIWSRDRAFPSVVERDAEVIPCKRQ